MKRNRGRPGISAGTERDQRRQRRKRENQKKK